MADPPLPCIPDVCTASSLSFRKDGLPETNPDIGTLYSFRLILKKLEKYQWFFGSKPLDEAVTPGFCMGSKAVDKIVAGTGPGGILQYPGVTILIIYKSYGYISVRQYRLIATHKVRICRQKSNSLVHNLLRTSCNQGAPAFAPLPVNNLRTSPGRQRTV